MSASIDKFLEDSGCGNIISNIENGIDGFCDGAANSGAACGGIQIVGGAESTVCEDTLSNQIKKKVSGIKDCQKALYQFTVEKTIKTLIKSDSNLLESLILQEQIFQQRLKIFENELGTDIQILNIVSAYNFSCLIIIIFFLLFTNNFR